jgi:hypothetical protein
MINSLEPNLAPETNASLHSTQRSTKSAAFAEARPW